MEMKTVHAHEGHFQGELYIGPVDAALSAEYAASKTLKSTRDAERVDGALIVGHSETGHHHVVEHADAKLLEHVDSQLTAFLVAEGAYADLVHKRDFDTHPTLRLEGTGVRKVVRQREVTPENERSVAWVPARD